MPCQQGERGTKKMKRSKIYANSARVTCHLRERGTKEKRSSTPMPHKKG
jgi:hypothetical protein